MAYTFACPRGSSYPSMSLTHGHITFTTAGGGYGVTMSIKSDVNGVLTYTSRNGQTSQEVTGTVNLTANVAYSFPDIYAPNLLVGVFKY